jgi:hypothetical protein
VRKVTSRRVSLEGGFPYQLRKYQIFQRNGALYVWLLQRYRFHNLYNQHLIIRESELRKMWSWHAVCRGKEELLRNPADSICLSVALQSFVGHCRFFSFLVQYIFSRTP